MKRHNETLKSLVARYQKELKDQSRSGQGFRATVRVVRESRSLRGVCSSGDEGFSAHAFIHECQ